MSPPVVRDGYHLVRRASTREHDTAQQMDNSVTLYFLLWLTAFFLLALMLNQKCHGAEQSDNLSVSSSIACGPSTVLFLIGTTPVSLEIVWCAWKYRVYHDPILLDYLAFLFAPSAVISLVLLAVPFNTSDHSKERGLCALVFFGSVYMHMLYVARRSVQRGGMGDKERCVCALATVATFLVVALGISHTGWQCERCMGWFAGAEIAYMAMVANYTYLLKTIVDAKDDTCLFPAGWYFEPGEQMTHPKVRL